MVHSALFEHVKLRKLCRLLSIPRPHAIGYLECLSHYVGNHHYDGDLSNMSDDDIEEAAEWQGEPGKFLAACIEVRLIDRDAAGTRLHDWLDWRPDYVRKRAQRRTTAHNGRPSRAEPSDYTLPYSTPEFTAAWKDWEQSRREAGKPLKPTTIRLQFRKLQEMGHDRAVAALRYSTANGYTGIFEEASRERPGKTGGLPQRGERITPKILVGHGAVSPVSPGLPPAGRDETLPGLRGDYSPL